VAVTAKIDELTARSTHHELASPALARRGLLVDDDVESEIDPVGVS
jgi:hypothetical protein